MGRLITCLEFNGQIFREDDVVEVTCNGNPLHKTVGRIKGFVRPEGINTSHMIEVDMSTPYNSSVVVLLIDNIDSISFHY